MLCTETHVKPPQRLIFTFFGIDLHEFIFWRYAIVVFFILFLFALYKFPLGSLPLASNPFSRMCKQKKRDLVACVWFFWLRKLSHFIASSREKQSEQTVNWKVRRYLHRVLFWLKFIKQLHISCCWFVRFVLSLLASLASWCCCCLVKSEINSRIYELQYEKNGITNSTFRPKHVYSYNLHALNNNWTNENSNSSGPGQSGRENISRRAMAIAIVVCVQWPCPLRQTIFIWMENKQQFMFCLYSSY